MLIRRTESRQDSPPNQLLQSVMPNRNRKRHQIRIIPPHKTTVKVSPIQETALDLCQKQHFPQATRRPSLGTHEHLPFERYYTSRTTPRRCAQQDPKTPTGSDRACSSSGWRRARRGGRGSRRGLGLRSVANGSAVSGLHHWEGVEELERDEGR
jgi:hypothetical protein